MPHHAPDGLPQKFIPLPAVKLVEEIFEVSGGRLLVSFQTKQLANFGVVKLIHGRYEL